MSDEPKAPVWTPPHDDTQTLQHADKTGHDVKPLTEAEAAVERVAFAELLAFINAHKDDHTEVTHASADEFAATLE